MLQRFLDTAGFMPRWVCGQWSPAEGWLHIAADIVIWLSYLAIPCVLVHFVRKRRTLPFRTVFLLFGAFILACGTTHLMDVLVFWWPAYRVAIAIKLVTALVSAATVAALFRVTPELLALRSPVELEEQIAERSKVEEFLRASEQRFRLLVEGVKEYAIFMLDPEGKVVTWNDGAERITGYTSGEVIGQNFAMFYTAEDRARHHPEAELAAALGVGHFEEEGRRLRKDGSLYSANVAITSLRDSSGRHVGFAKVTRDTSEIKAAQERMAAALREKESMLKEIHHRVKNNLTVISSLIYLQSLHAEGGAATQILQESQDRIRSMALVHETLYSQDSFTGIAFGDYVQALASQLIRTYTLPSQAIQLQTRLEDLRMDMDAAVPCGLVLNELISNSLKHAFLSGANGTITVSLRRLPEGPIELVVRDDGAGPRNEGTYARSNSLGLRLVHTLARQMDGTFEIRAAHPGTEARLVFGTQPSHE